MNRRPLHIALSVVLLLTSEAASLPAAEQRSGQSPFVDSRTVKTRFADITGCDMELLRSKKILFASRSFGLNMCNGLKALARQDAKYEFLSSYQRFDVLKAGGDVSVIPSDVR